MNEWGSRVWMIWGSALAFAGIRALVSRSGDSWPDLVSWVLLAPLVFAWTVLFFSWILRRLMRVTWDQSLGFGLEHASVLTGVAIVVDTLVAHDTTHVFTIRSVHDTLVALCAFDLYPSSAMSIGVSIGFLVSGAWLWQRLRPHVAQSKLVITCLQGYIAWIGVMSIPSLLAWIQAPRIGWAGSTALLARAFTLIHQDGYWWASVFTRFPGTIDGELISSERLFIASMLWVALAGICIPWRSLVNAFRTRPPERLSFFAYGGLIALLMGMIPRILPTNLVSGTMLVIVACVMLGAATMPFVARAGIALTGSWLLGWPIFALVAFLLLCEQVLAHLPSASAEVARQWLGGMDSIAWALLCWSWMGLAVHPTGIPWAIVIAVLALHALPAMTDLVRRHAWTRSVPHQILTPLVYVGVGAVGSGVSGLLLGAACGSLALFFPQEQGRFSWKNMVILWAFLIIHAVMVLLHPLRP